MSRLKLKGLKDLCFECSKKLSKMNVFDTAILKVSYFSGSCNFRLWFFAVSAKWFTVGTEEYSPRYSKVNDLKAFKNCYYNCITALYLGSKWYILARLIGAFLNQVNRVIYTIESN